MWVVDLESAEQQPSGLLVAVGGQHRLGAEAAPAGRRDKMQRLPDIWPWKDRGGEVQAKAWGQS